MGEIVKPQELQKQDNNHNLFSSRHLLKINPHNPNKSVKLSMSDTAAEWYNTLQISYYERYSFYKADGPRLYAVLCI